MTEYKKSAAGGPAQKFWRKCLVVGSALLAMSFFACNPNVSSGGGASDNSSAKQKYTVNHHWENVAGDGYDMTKAELKGKAGSETEAALQEKEGFELDTAKHPAGKIAQQKIKGDGSTVIDIYYARKTITLTFDPNGGKIDGKTGLKKLTDKFGRKVVAPTKPEKSGHTFMDWAPNLPKTFPATDAGYKAVWEVGKLPVYKVEHWQQQINLLTGKVYDAAEHKEPNYKIKDTDEKNGKKGELTKAKAKEYLGFKASSVTQGTIAADGSTVVKIYYVRNDVTLTFDPNGGKFGASADNKKVQGKYGEKVTETISKPEKTGMKFSGWKSRTEVRVDPPATFPEEDVTYTAQWKSRESANYTVRHWKQPIIGDTYTDKVEESLSGIVDEDTQAQAKTYEGFHLSKVGHAGGKIVQQKIKADGKTVVDIYYDRNIFTAKFNTDGGNSISDMSGRYEAALLSPTNPTKEGKEFVKWEPPLPTTFTKNTEHKAIWKDPVPQEASYTVEHWTQEIDTATGKAYPEDKHTHPNYVLQDQDTNKTGKIGELTAANARTDGKYKGYNAPSVTQGTIAADGSTVVKIYYVRKDVTLTFKPNGGKFGASADNKKVQGKYEEKFKEADIGKLTKDDADFDEWSPRLPEKFPEEDKEYTAQWKTVKGVKIESEPSQKEYSIGDAFDGAGLKVYVEYDKFPKRLITKDDYTISGFDSTAAGTKTVTVTYKGKSASFTVTVKTATPPSETYAFGDIIGKDGAKYKKESFTPESGKTWQDYYVIISVSENTYVGAQYQVDSLGSLLTSSNSSFTYDTYALTKSGNRYLTKDDVAEILAKKIIFNESIQKTGCSSPKPDFAEENILYKEGSTFYDGNNDARVMSSGTFVPIAARTFTK